MFETITQSLMDYNGPIFQTVDTIRTQAIQPIGITILVIMFYFEFLNTRQMFQDGGGDLELAFFAPIIMRYTFAYIGVTGAGWILKMFLSLMITVTTKIQVATGSTGWGSLLIPDINLTGGLWEKAMQIGVWIVAFIIGIIAVLVAKILVFMMYIMLYILYAISPLLLPTLVSEEHRVIGVNFLKAWIGTALEGPIIAITLTVLHGLATSNALNADGLFTAGTWTSLNPAISMLLQGLGTLFVLIGSGALANRLIRG